VYDSVGKGTFEQSLACLKPRGTLVLYGSAGGDVPPLDLIRLATLGSLYVTRPILRDYTLAREELVMRATEGFHTVATRKLHFRIEKTYSLEEDRQVVANAQKGAQLPDHILLGFCDQTEASNVGDRITSPLRHFSTP
jgi:NADPH:quinone reductase-like Zn-dependent oxidoreductase